MSLTGHLLLLQIIIHLFITPQSYCHPIEHRVTKNENDLEVCRTKTCIDAANSMKATANLDANPCNDFYQFACGNTRGRTLRSRATEEAQMNANQLVRNLAKESNNPNMDALSTYYDSCVVRNEQNFTYISNLIRRFDPENDDEQETPTLSDVVNRLAVEIQLEGFQNPFLGSYTTFKIPDTSKIFIKLEPRIFSTKENFANLIGILQLNHLSDKKLIERIESIKRKLARIVKGPSITNPEFITIDELNSIAPSISWDLILPRLYDPDGSKGVNGSETVIVTHRDYLINLSNLLAKLDPRDLKHFLIFQMIDEAATYSAHKLARFASQSLLRTCAETLKEQLGFLYSLEYSKHYVSDQRRSSVLKMFDRLRTELDYELMSLDWVDEQTKMRARFKVANMRALIAYPEEFLEGSLLDRISGYFKQEKFARNSYLTNVLALKRSEHQFDADSLHSSYRALPWLRFKDSTSVNAFYEDAFNSINVLAGQLNNYLHNEMRPEYLNYALVGSTIGHELTHAFDRGGVRLDEQGDWHIWWSIESETAYVKRLDCVRQLYDNLQIPGGSYFKLNGTRTLDENMADLVGLRLARKAYLKELEKTGKNEPTLAGLEQFNGRQLFWLNYGTNWCSSLTPSEMAKLYGSDTHSPEPIRVNVPLQNIAEFASDFNCPRGSPMNPTQKRVDCDLL